MSRLYSGSNLVRTALINFCRLVQNHGLVSGLNPNPKTAADYKRNSQVLEELNKNHEDDMFRLQAKKVTTCPNQKNYTGCINVTENWG